MFPLKRTVIPFFIWIIPFHCFSFDSVGDTLKLADSSRIEARSCYFFNGYTYGSQAIFNPATVALNRGFEMLRITTGGPYYDPWQYSYRFDNVFENLAHPFRNVSNYGTANFFKEQVIPLASPKKHYWYPNYTLHLIGGGITYTGLNEWFMHNKVACPRLLSASIIIGSALFNEAIEERQRSGFNLNVDVIADFYLFDITGILLFNSKKVNHFFSTTLNMRDWSRQPSILFPGSLLSNCGQFFSLKWKVPMLKNWYYFQLMGLSGLGGASYKFRNNTFLSVGIGRGTQRQAGELFGLPVNVSLVPMVGLYFDKNNSLLVSLEFSKTKDNIYHDYFVNMNIYPGLIQFKGISPSCWFAVSKDGKVIGGFTSKYTFGLGLGFR